MSGGINDSKQFIGIAVRKPYSNEYFPTLQRYSDTEAGITEAHGHADQLAEKLNIPREAIGVSRYHRSTSMVVASVPRPVKKAPMKKTKAAPAVPALNEAVVTKGGKSTVRKLGGK
jgi:hypothetical protein